LKVFLKINHAKLPIFNIQFSIYYMTDILFGQSYYLRFDPKLWEAMQPYPPLGTLYAASYMRQRGYHVAVFDAMLAASEEEWGQALDRHEPQFAVIYEDNFNYLSKMCLLRMRKAAFEMISMARQRNCTVIVAGSDPSDHASNYLEQGAHFVIIGEGEITLGELLDSLTGRSRTALEEIRGLAFADERHCRQSASRPIRNISATKTFNVQHSTLNIVQTPRRPDIRDLDVLPFPAWDLINISGYRDIWLERHGYYSMNMATTRGCPFHCNWCAKPIWGQRYNVRSPENVIAEMNWLQDNYQPDHIWFVDDIFGLKPGWVSRFAELAESQDTTIPFKCLDRVDLLLREGEIESLRQAGCEIVWVGAESGSQKVLDAMDKGTRVDQIYAAAQALKSAGIQVGFFLQFGYPGEDRADIEMTLKMVRECQPDDIGMSVSYPLPGTKFFDSVKTQLGSQQNWVDSNDLAMLYSGPFTTAFYRQLHAVLHKEFRLRKALANITKAQRDSGPGPKMAPGKQPTPLGLAKALLKNALSLPIARLKLKWLARAPHQRPKPIASIMSRDEAATPSPQHD
jgi:anaerobic magnesium-protoporphyrin IX monomethyl ester cyclase